MYAGGTASLKPRLNFFGGGGCHRTDSAQAARVESMGAPVVQTDDLDAGGSLCPCEHLRTGLREDRQGLLS